MKIVLSTERKYRKFLTEKTFPLNQSQTVFSRLEKKAQEQFKLIPCTLTIVDEEGNGLFRDNIIFGDELPKNILYIVQSALDTNFQETSEQEKKEFLTSIEKNLIHKESEEELPNEIKKIEKPVKQKKKKTRKRNKISFPKIHLSQKKMLFIVLPILLVLCIGSFFLVKSQNKPSDATLNDYLLEENYLEAGELFPDKTTFIENELFVLSNEQGEKYIDKLKEFNHQYPTIFGDFDVAMFSQTYQKALKIYESNKKIFSEDSTRLVLVGYSYLKAEKLTEAEAVNKLIKNNELEKYILKYQQTSLQIEEIQKELETLQTEPTKNKDQIEQLIEELYNAKEDLANL